MIANFGLLRRMVSAGMVWLAVSPMASAQTASNFQIDAGHTGAIEMPGFEGPITPIWSVDLDGAISYPLVANGMVYVNAIYPNNNAVRLVALSAKTGKIVWQRSSSQGESYGAAAYDNGVIFEVTSSGYLHALEAKTGQVIWFHKLVYQYNFQEPPVAANGYLALTGNGGGATAYVIKEQKGETLWMTNISNALIPALSQEHIFLSADCTMYAINISNGEPLWSDNENCEGELDSATALYQGHVFRLGAGDGAGLVVDAATGEIEGSFNSPTPAFRNGVAFQAIGPMIVASEIASGNIVWSFTPPDAALSAPPIIINNTLYGLTSGGSLYALNSLTGKINQILNPGVGPNAGQYEVVTAGLGAGQGILVVPSGSRIVAYGPTPTRSGDEDATKTLGRAGMQR